MCVMTAIDEIVENFALLEEWDDRYRYVIELGRTLPPLPESAHSEANKVQGCASQVWLLTHVKPNGSSGPVLTFEGDSDAHIVRGLIAILFALYSGKSAREILDIRRTGAVRPDWSPGESYASTLKRLAFDGAADPHRSRRGFGCRSIATVSQRRTPRHQQAKCAPASERGRLYLGHSRNAGRGVRARAAARSSPSAPASRAHARLLRAFSKNSIHRQADRKIPDLPHQAHDARVAGRQ